MKGFQQNLFSKTPLSEIKKKSIPIGKNIKLKSDTSKTNTYQPNLFNKLQNKIEQLEEKIIELEIKKEEEKEVELNPLQFFGRVKEKSEHLNDREELDKEIRKLPFKLDYEDIPFQTAQNAYNFRSFSPDRRAIQTQNDYVKYFINLYKELSPLAKTEESKEELIYQIERYKEAFLKRKKALLYRSSNIASSVITGGGNFPARKMQKRMDAEHNAEGEFYKFQDKVEKIIYRKLRGLNGDYDFISVGDKDAKEKLEKKLDNLLKERERNNEINKHFRKHKNYKNFPLTEIEKKILSSYKKTWNMEYIPSYVNSNLSQNISRLKDRILELKRIEEMKESSKDLEHNGIKLIYNEDIQRVQIQFPGKPDKDIIKELKSRGFKWSPRENSWQRLLNQQGMRIAKDLFIKFSGYTPEPEPEQPKEKQKGKTLNDYIQELGLTKEFYKKSNGVSFVKIYNSEGKIVLDTKAEPANVLKKLKEYEKNINIPYFNFEIGKPYYMIKKKTKSILPYRIIDIDRENNFITYKFLSGQQPEKKVRLYSEGKEY
ncbi:MAG: hypothetical protein KDK36_06245, partial [Leptospiraceae bacterium]|nr:hypothetical protein [Leptospiraceae bacterium]